MDFSSIIKGASDTLKKLETDVTNAGKEIGLTSEQTGPAWKEWEPADDDAWEDVADIHAPAEPADVSADAAAAAAGNAHVSANAKAAEGGEGAVRGSDVKVRTTDCVVGAEMVSDAPADGPAGAGAGADADADADADVAAKELPSTAPRIAELQAKLKDALDRANASERKVFALTRDRDALRRARDSRAGDAELVKEKDKQITAILNEGEKLSIKIADKEAHVRTLKQQVKERDAAVETLQFTLSATEAKIEAVASRHRQLETSEKSAQDAREAAERRLRQVESEARSKSSSSAAVEAARAQLESLRKSQTASLENQSMRLRAEHESALEAVVSKSKSQEDSLNKAITELRTHLSQVVDSAGWREDQLRKECLELRHRAEQLEARNEELAAALPDATRPLVRQVEALQAAASERARAKSAVEKAQLERLRAAEAAAVVAGERERSAEERIGSLMTRIALLEEQVKLSGAEQARLGVELRQEQSKVAENQLKHQHELEVAQSATLKLVREKERVVEELTRERASNLDASEASEEQERALRNQIGGLEAKLEVAQERLAKASSASAQRSADVVASLASPRLSRRENGTGKDVGLGAGSGGYDDDSSALAESAAVPSGMYATERLTSSLRQRNGEIVSLQAQLDSKEAATQALAEEVVSLTARVEEIFAELKDAPEVRKELDELKRRHSALLELLGEREERIMELEADLTDVNQMYKEQITELLLRLEK